MLKQLQTLFVGVCKVALIATALLVSSCASDDTSDDNNETDDGSLRIESFTVTDSDNVTITATVDNVARTVNIPNVARGYDIEAVNFKTNIRANFSPLITTKLGLDWEESFELNLISTDTDESAIYTITLVDYYDGEENILRVDPTKTKQQVLFIGADMERSQNTFLNCTNREEVGEWCFKDIDFNVCRVSYDKQQELVEGTTNFEFYDSCVEAMRCIRLANPNVKFWATLKSDYEGYGTENNLPAWICNMRNDDGTVNSNYTFESTKYARFLADYCKYFHSKGYTIDYMSTGKEWTGYITIDRAKIVIEYLQRYLPQDDCPVPLFVDPSGWGVGTSTTWINNANSKGMGDHYYGFCTHNYPGGDDRTYNFTQMVDAAESFASNNTNSVGENQFWVVASETGGGTMGGNGAVDSDTDMTTGMLDAFREKCEYFEQGFNGELIFEIFSRNKASETRAVYFCNSAATRMSNYYALQSHGNYFQDGMNYIEAERIYLQDDVYTMHFANEDQMYVAVINLGETAIDALKIDLNDTAYNGSVEQHTMDEQTVKVQGILSGYKVSNRNLSNGCIYASIPAVSGNFFKIDLTKSDN